MHTPSPAVLSFFRAHGRPASNTLAMARTHCDFFLTQASDLVASLDSADTPCHTKIACADLVAAACAGALLAAHGLMLGQDESLLRQDDALDVLEGELELSTMTRMPLHELRRRAAELTREPAAKSSDAFLAHQGSFIGAGILEWTTERTAELLAH